MKLKSSLSKSVLLAMSSMGLVAVGPQVLAEAIEEIVITAQKREQNLNDVSVAVSAYNGNTLEDLNLETAEDLQYLVPGMTITSFWGKTKPNISIRGAAVTDSFRSTDPQPFAVHMDEVFLSSRTVQIFQMYDLERVEVLRGPQGILFGKNTVGGSFNYYTRRPGDEFGGYINAGLGKDNARTVEGAVNIPLSESLKSRIAFNHTSNDGWATNVVNGEDVYDEESTGVRLALDYTTDAATFGLTVYRGEMENDDSLYYSIEPFSDFLDYDEIASSVGEAPEDLEQSGANLKATFDLREDLQLVSLTAYDKNEYSAAEDFSAPLNADFPVPGRTGGFIGLGFSLPISYTDEVEQFSQELRLAYETESLHLTGGAYYFTETLDSTVGVFGVNTNTQDTDAYAVFINGSYHINDVLTFNAGLRHSVETKDHTKETPTFTVGLDDTWREQTWKIGIDYTPDDASLYYASYARGFLGGAFNAGASTPELFNSVDPTLVDSFEIGAKKTLWGGRMQVNAALFYNEVKDLQVQTTQANQNGTFDTLFQNAAEIESKGVEAELMIAPVENLLFNVTLAWVDSEYASFPDYKPDASNPGQTLSATGNEVVNTPEFTASIVGRYDYVLSDGSTLSPSFTYSHTDEHFYRVENSEETRIDSRNLLSVSLLWTSADERYHVSLWSKNVTDEEYDVLRLPVDGPESDLFVKRGRDRSYGINFGAKFGD